MSLIKITILGDIMCEPRLLKAAKRAGGGNHDFSGVFRNVQSLFEESNYVIGNLETPLAGSAAGYVSSLFRFNAPDSFAFAARDAGIDLLLTANNHCLDRGLDGLKRTVQVLDENNIPHAGTFEKTEKRGNTYVQIGDLRVALISYTYGTNYRDNHIVLSDEEKGYVNLLRPQTELYFVPRKQDRSVVYRVLNKIANMFNEDKKYYARAFLGIPVNQPHDDDNLILDTLKPYLQQLIKDIDEAKQNADFVLFCPHIGGQFNETPGAFSRYIFSVAAERGVDAIVASHAHVVHEAELKGCVPCFYSVGNFSMSPNSIYLLHENLPEYGIAVHLYLEEGRLSRTSFSVLKIVEKDLLTVYPADDYVEHCSKEEKNDLLRDVRRIHMTVTGRPLENDVLQREYLL